MLLLDDHGVMLDLWVSKDLGVVVHGCTQHIKRPKVVKPGVARFSEKNRLQGRQQGITVLGAGLACGEARVVGEMGKLRSFAET